MACSDRQLQQSQITQGFSTRAGVQQAIRPFTGEPSGSNLMDYLNRELFPVVKALRSKVNEVYLPAKENASSANPLSYIFSKDTANADPTLGRIRLNQAVQNTATVIRVSETNAARKNAATWLSVMQGGSTTPLGVVTLSDAADPGRFIRFNMSALVDNGAYWDLTVTPVESSHPSPFSADESILVSYIAGVASGGVSLATNVAAIRGVSAGTQLLTSGTLSFANSNNISFGINNGTITASVLPALNNASLVSLAASQAQSITNATDSVFTGGTLFLDLQGTAFNSSRSHANVQFRLSSNTLMGAAVVGFIAGTRNQPAQSVSFQDANGLTWSLNSNTFAGFGVLPGVFANYAAPRAVSAGTQQMTAGTLVLANSNDITFGMSGSSQVTASYQQQFGLVSHIGGNVVSSVRSLAFSNASNVTWSLSTAANAATVIASVAAGGGGGETKTISLASYAASQSSSVSNATDVSFSGNPLVFQFLETTNDSLFSRANVVWKLSGGSMIGVAPQLYFAGIAGLSANVLSFADANGVSFGAASSTSAGFGRVVTITATADPRLGIVSHVGGNAASSVTRLAFSNASGVTFSLSTAANAATVLASVNDQSLGMVSHVGVGSVGSVTRLAFSNASNVTWSLVTAAGAATVVASVAAESQTFLGAIAGGTQTATSGTIVFSNSNDFTFGLSGSTRMTASYLPQIGLVSHIGGNQVSSVTRLAFSNASNVTFSLSTAANAATLLASVNAAAAGGIAIAASGSTQSDSTVQFARPTVLDGGMASATLGNVAFAFNTGASSTQINATALMRITANLTTTGGFPVSKLEFRDGGGIQWGVATSNDAEGRGVQVTAKLADLNMFMHAGVGSGFVGANTSSSLWLSPFSVVMPGNITADTFEIMAQPAGPNSSAYSWTLRGGLYRLTNSTQLTLVNSFSTTASSTTQATSAWNNLIAGDRYVTVASSLWSSSPVFSAGVQYWLGLVPATAGGVALIGAWLCNRFWQQAGTGFKGVVGVSQAASKQKNQEPFMGLVSTTGIPVSIGTVGVLDAGPTYSGVLPAFNLRQGIFR